MISPNRPAPPRVVAFSIPGVPVAQGRGRAVRCGGSVRVIDPAKSRSWKVAEAKVLARIDAALDPTDADRRGEDGDAIEAQGGGK